MENVEQNYFFRFPLAVHVFFISALITNLKLYEHKSCARSFNQTYTAFRFDLFLWLSLFYNYEQMSAAMTELLNQHKSIHSHINSHLTKKRIIRVCVDENNTVPQTHTVAATQPLIYSKHVQHETTSFLHNSSDPLQARSFCHHICSLDCKSSITHSFSIVYRRVGESNRLGTKRKEGDFRCHLIL